MKAAYFHLLWTCHVLTFFASSYWIGRAVVSSSLPLQCLHATDDFTDHCDTLLHSFFFPRGRLIGCFIIPYTIVFLNSFPCYYLFRLGRYQPSLQYSICIHIVDLDDRLMFVFQLCSLLSILLPFPSYFWYSTVLAIIEDWIGINLNYLLQPSWSTEFELTAYNFI